MAKRDRKRFENGDGAPNGASFTALPTPNIDERIRERAYQLYVERGESPGSPEEDWLRAESEERQALDASLSNEADSRKPSGQASRFRQGLSAAEPSREHRSNDFS